MATLLLLECSFSFFLVAKFESLEEFVGPNLFSFIEYLIQRIKQFVSEIQQQYILDELLLLQLAIYNRYSFYVSDNKQVIIYYNFDIRCIIDVVH